MFSFCLRVQLVMLVSTPKSLFSTSRTASSVGTGMMSMESIMGRSVSARSEIMLSLMNDAYSRRYRTRPKRSPILKWSGRASRLSGMMLSLKEWPFCMESRMSRENVPSSPVR